MVLTKERIKDWNNQGQGQAFAHTSQKIPHMGWNDLISANDHVFRSGDYVYFIHSYYCDRKIDHMLLKRFESVCCAVSKDNILATQFHPEKVEKWVWRF